MLWERIQLRHVSRFLKTSEVAIDAPKVTYLTEGRQGHHGKGQEDRHGIHVGES